MIEFTELFDTEQISQAMVAVGCLAPGFIISFVRSKFMTGRMRSISEISLEYLISSAIYYGSAGPILIGYFSATWLNVFLFLFIGPAVVGLLLGLAAQKDWIGQFFGRWGIRYVHPMPTSWDYTFSSLRSGVWIVVTLKNHEQIFGYFGDKSFASSDLERRDLYIQDIRDSKWMPIEQDGRTRGLWVTEDEISMIEITADEVIK